MNNDEDFENPVFVAFKYEQEKLKEKYIKEGRLQAYRKALKMVEKERDTLWELYAHYDKSDHKDDKILAQSLLDQSKQANFMAISINYLIGEEEAANVPF